MELLKLAQYWNYETDENKETKILDDVAVDYCVPDVFPSNKKRKKRWSGCTSLHFAANKLDLNQIAKLLQQGANPIQQTTDDKCTPVHIAFKKTMKTKFYNSIYMNATDRLEHKLQALKACRVINTFLSEQIKSKKAVNPKNEHRVSHLHIACIVNNKDAVNFFAGAKEPLDQPISYEAIDDNDDEDEDLSGDDFESLSQLQGYTPLHCAIKYSSAYAVLVLLQNNADIHAKNAKGMSCIHLLVEHMMELTDYMTIGKRTLCMEIVEEMKTVECIIKLVLITQASIRIFVDDIGFSAFHLACTLKDKSMIEGLLKKNVDVNVPVKSESKFWPGWTPLHFAACCNVETMILLMQHGADVTIQNSKGETPLDLCARRFALSDIQSVLLKKEEFKNIVLSDNHTNLLDLLSIMDDCKRFEGFLQKLEDVNLIIPNDSPIWPGYNLLHLSISLNEKNKIVEDIDNLYAFVAVYGENITETYNCTDEEKALYIERIKLCLEYGCSLSMTNANGQTPIHLAFYMLKKDTVKTLMNYCKDEVVDGNGTSHLHIASVVGHLKAVKICLSKGANVNIRVKKSFDWPAPNELRTKYPIESVRIDSTPLHLAVVFHHCKLIKYLVENNADVYATDSLGFTPVHLLMSANKYVAEELLKAVPNLRESVSKDGLTHLHVATYLGSEEAVKQILLNGAEVDRVVNVNVKEPPFLARLAGKTPLHTVRSGSDNKVVEALLRAGANVQARNLKGISVLQRSVNELDFTWTDPLVKMLKNGECDVGASGITLLHFACGAYDIEWAKKLLEKGADVNAKISTEGIDSKGATPLYFILISYSVNAPGDEITTVDFVKLLLAYGADVTINCCGRTPLQYLYSEVIYYFYDLESDDAEHENFPHLFDIANLMLESQKSYDVNPLSCIDGFSHFHFACVLNNAETARKFLDRGIEVNQLSIDPFARNIGGFTPLHFATAHHSEEVVYMLLERGADVNAQDAYGHTPLHVAMKKKFVDLRLIKTMINLGADINAKNITGDTPFYCLLKFGDLTLERLEFFLELGCSINMWNNTDKYHRGILGLAMVNTEPSEWKPILERLVQVFEVKDAIQSGFTAIHSMVAISQDGKLTVSNYLKSIELLKGVGCELDQQDTDGRTALHIAAKFYNLEAVHALLLLGADVNVLDNKNECPLSCGVMWVQPVERNDDYERRKKEVNQTLARQIWKIKFLGLNENRPNLKCLRMVEKHVHFVDLLKQSCREELEKAQKTEICKSIYVSDFLWKFGAVVEYPTMYYAQRHMVDEFFKRCNELLREFPELFGVLACQYRQALARTDLLQPAKEAIVLICQIELPDLCSEAILRYFTNNEMKSVIQLAEQLFD